MKSNIERFVKYLDGQIDSIEKESFEIELNQNADLKREFEKFKNTYFSVNNNFELEEDYFTNLLPKVKERISTKSFHWNYKYGLVFVILLISIVYFFVPSNHRVPNISLSTFVEEVSSDDELAMSFLEINLNENEDLDLVSEYYSDEIISDDELFKYLDEDISFEEINDSLLFVLTDFEINSIYDLIIEKKIIGE